MYKTQVKVHDKLRNIHNLKLLVNKYLNEQAYLNIIYSVLVVL